MPDHDRLVRAFETRALEVPPSGAVVVLRAAPSGFLDLVPADRLRCVQTFRPTHDLLAAAGRPVSTRIEGPAAMVVVNLTRSRAETLGNVAAGLQLLEPGGRLVVTGAKNDGVDGIARQFAAVLPVEGAYVKAHGRVFWASRPAVLPEAVAAWAREAAPRMNADGFLSGPGMFSADAVDPGSRRLAGALAGRLSGRVADLGAGWGWLAKDALARNPEIESIDLYEAELNALDAARTNLSDPRARFHWRDVVGLTAADGPCDWVISNSPFHESRAAEPDLGAAFIAAAARILRPNGRLALVANRQLPYEAVLASNFGRWEKLSEAGGYKVLEAERPRRR